MEKYVWLCLCLISIIRTLLTPNGWDFWFLFYSDIELSTGQVQVPQCRKA